MDWTDQTVSEYTTVYAKCLHCSGRIPYPYNMVCPSCKKDHFVVGHFRTDYFVWEYHGGRYADVAAAYPVFGYDLICGFRFKTMKEAHEVVNRLRTHRKKNPGWWEIPKSQGGYGLGAIKVLAVSKCKVKERSSSAE